MIDIALIASAGINLYLIISIWGLIYGLEDSFNESDMLVKLIKNLIGLSISCIILLILLTIKL